MTQLLKADYAVLLGDKAGARASVDSLLSALPKNIGGLSYDAQLKKAAGQRNAAVESAEKALDQVYLETPESSEPPVELLSLLATLSEVVPVPPITVEFENKKIAVKWEA